MMTNIKSLVLVLFISFISEVYSQELKVATYNLRYNIEENHKFDSTRGEDWARRGPAIAALIRFHEFEIFGTQEGLLHQLEDLSGWLPGFAYVGAGRDDGKKGGEHTAVFYKNDRFRVLDHGDFWLSETPDQPSMGWDATCCNRLCTWIYFEELESKKRFYFFNTHFDHQGIIARKESSKLVLRKIREIAGVNPVIFMGDLNGGHDSDWYKILSNSDMLLDTYQQLKFPYANNGSFNGFGRRNSSNQIIDHIFTSDHFEIIKWGILTDSYYGKFPSDHFPVMVELKLVEN